MLAQIRAGCWVRNGYAIRTQAHHYREATLRESTADQDFYLIQVASVIFSPLQFLAWIMHRFDLLSTWFRTTRITHAIYDLPQEVFMMEELLHLLILTLSERTKCSFKCVQADEVEREIIHATIKSISHSEILKRIPERHSQDAQFDEILRKVCQFKAPGDGWADSGTYELKSEYLDQVDPYFLHYTRNQRIEAEEALTSRYAKVSPSSPYFSVPKLVPIDEASPFYDNLGKWTQTPVFCALLYFTLKNALSTLHPSTSNQPAVGVSMDLLLDELVHIFILACLIENELKIPKNEGFSQLSREHFVRENPNEDGETLASLMINWCKDHEKTVELQNKLEYALDLAFGGRSWITPDETNTGHKQGLSNNKESTDLGGLHEKETMDKNEIAEEEEEGTEQKKKTAAKALQNKMLQDFAQAQAEFMKNYEFMMDDDEEEEEDMESSLVLSPTTPNLSEKIAVHDYVEHHHKTHPQLTKWSYPTGTCIVCQETLDNKKSVFGMVAFVQPSTVLKWTTMDDPDVLHDALNCTVSNSTEPYHTSPKSRRTGFVITSCGHFIHSECFDGYFESVQQRHTQQPTRNHPEDVTKREFLCPLCKSLNNLLIPMRGRDVRDKPLVAENNPDFETWLKQERENLNKLVTPESIGVGGTMTGELNSADGEFIQFYNYINL